jgi:FkbM family methyltransferase
VIKDVLRKAYRRVPFKQPVFEAMRRLGAPPENVYKHLHFQGVFETKVGNRSFKMRHHGFEIENQLFWAGGNGGWERVSLGLWQKLCARAQVIYDIGANTGVYALHAKTINPRAEVRAFEPVKRVFERLRDNVELNAFDIACEEVAVSDADGEAVIFDPGGEHVLSVTVNKDLSEPGVKTTPQTVSRVRLDSYLEGQRAPAPDLLKIDVETHEFEVLSGLGDHLAQTRPTMLIEILNDEVGAAVESLVADLGYLYFNIDERKSSPTLVPHIGVSDYYNYLLCAEAEARLLGLL